MEKIKILIIEDEESINNIVKSYLVKEGYEVYQAFDGEEGLKAIFSKRINWKNKSDIKKDRKIQYSKSWYHKNLRR